MIPGEYYVRVEVDGKAMTDENHCGSADARGLLYFYFNHK